MSWNAYLNPFFHLVETKRNRLARILRSSFSQRVWDTMRLYYGKGFLPNTQLGLLDYCLVIPALVFAGIAGILFYAGGALSFLGGLFGAKLSSLSASLVVVQGGILGVLFGIPKMIVTGVLMVFTLPIIGIVHGVLSSRQKRLRAEINALLTKDQKIGLMGDQIEIELSEESSEKEGLLKREGDKNTTAELFELLDSEKIQVTVKQVEAEGENRRWGLEFFSELPSKQSQCSQEKRIEIVEFNKERALGIRALLETNSGNFLKNIEDLEERNQSVRGEGVESENIFDDVMNQLNRSTEKRAIL